VVETSNDNKSQQICCVSKEAVGSHKEAAFDREFLPSRLSWEKAEPKKIWVFRV
jgi:hypothetical protein